MRRFREIFGVAWQGLIARKTRTLLITLGPVLGVAAIVAAVGMSESAKGDLKQALADLGTNLVIVSASDTFGGAQGGVPTLPIDAEERVLRVPTVTKVTSIAEVGNARVLPTEQSESFFEALPTAVRVADEDFPDVLDVELVNGRWLNQADERPGTRAAVLGIDLANEFQHLTGEIRTVEINGKVYSVIGVLERVSLIPTVNSSVFIGPTAAEDDFDIEPDPTNLYLRVEDGTTAKSIEIIPTAIGLGGNETVTTEVPSSLLEAEAQVDATLRAVVIAMGGLALIVGGVGIANVMSISVIQRSSEIGIRRALGHTRSIIGFQFMIEAFLVGIAGGAIGALAGALAVNLGARLQGWVFTLDPLLLVWAAALAVVVATIAGIYPAAKAARLEPLETLRLG